jgi:lysophospholipase L1-like esterase
MMNDSCREKKVQFIVVLIPTKESVFAEHINKETVINDDKMIYDVIHYEGKVNKMIKAYFIEHDIEYFDVLDHLKNTVKEMRIYPSNLDGHPNKNGYAAIAGNLARYLNQKE